MWKRGNPGSNFKQLVRSVEGLGNTSTVTRFLIEDVARKYPKESEEIFRCVMLLNTGSHDYGTTMSVVGPSFS